MILAGVTLSLVSGGDGILSKASSAVDTSNEETAKEQVMLKMSEFQTQFYDEVYVNQDISVNTKMGDWIAETKTGEIKAEDYKFKITGDNAPYTVTILKNNNLKTEIIGSLTQEGKVDFEGSGSESNGSGSGENGENESGGSETGGSETAISLSQITVENYGEYVNLGTSYVKGNTLDISTTETETATEDWRIFHKDSSGGVYLILADYLPYSYETGATAGSSTGLGTGLKNYGSSYPYCWRSTTSKSDLLTRLDNSTAWNKLLNSTYIEKGITVKGAVEMETYKDSWNAKGYTTMYLAGDDTNGYKVGASANPTSYEYGFNSSTGYSDTLYYPQKSVVSNNGCYWLASPSAASTSYVMYVGYWGYVSYSWYYHEARGVRPAVYLPSDIPAEKNADGVWEIDLHD